MLVDLGRNYKYTAIINPTQLRYLGRKHIIAKTKPDKIKTLANFARVQIVCCIRTKHKLEANFVITFLSFFCPDAWRECSQLWRKRTILIGSNLGTFEENVLPKCCIFHHEVLDIKLSLKDKILSVKKHFHYCQK